MPPRRATQKAQHGGTSTSLAENIQQVTAKIDQGVAQWTESGQADIQSSLKALLDQVDSTSLGPLHLSNALIGIIKSDLSLEQIIEAFSGLIDQLQDDEDKVLHFGEALADVVEVLQESKEDTSDLRAGDDAMDQDGQEKPMSPEDKGLETIRSLMGSGHLSSHVVSLLLSPDLLLRLSLHPYPDHPEFFSRAYIRRGTTLFFKQSKYNLLRESSEGFSALVVLLTGSDAFSSRQQDESDAARRRRAEQVWGKIMALIGYFNLSPPRVLDLILEVASCQIAAQWKFLLDLLRCSPWGSAEKAGGKGKERARDQWMEDETTAIEHALDAGGDRVLCQVLGVKFGFYQRQDGGETPYGLVVMSGLLVKHGLVGLSDLMAFVSSQETLQEGNKFTSQLSPDDAQMKPIHDAYLASTSSRSGPSNALSNSVLIDDEEGASSTTKAEDSGPPPKPPPEQRIMLLQALLAIGDLASAMVILARFPWLAQSHPAIADLIMRNVAYALEPLYQTIRQAMIDEDGEIDEEVALPGYPVTNRQILTPTYLFPQPPDTASARYEFFYPDWKDKVDQWMSVEDLLYRGLRWLGLIRGTAGRQVETMVKICRIGAAHFAALRRNKEMAQGLVTGAKTKEEIQSVEPTHDEMKPWLDLLRVSLLPALSTSSGAAAFDVELWYFLRHLPYPVRYSLYGEWRDSTCRPIGRAPCPAASHAAAEATREIKKALSRVTASQSAPSGPAASTDRGPARALAKLSHSNPHALWSTAVTQVKAYPNIGQFIVEAGRYMTQMSTDVAMFTLVDTLSDDTVSRLNPNGTDVAQWLASLATFVGDFNRRYASMDLEPVLQFIINRLMRSDSADLTILDKLISIMTGVAQVENDAISDEQLQAYAAGREMVKEAFNATLISIARPTDPSDATAKPKGAPIDKARSTKRSLPRLINALRFTELAIPIWIALGQTRQGAVDKMASAPIKAISAMQDTVHGTFVQFGDLLAENLSPEEHVNLTPDLASLVSDYGLDFSVAFLILRPRLNAELAQARSAREAAVRLKLAAAKEQGLRASLSPSQENSPLPSPKSPSMEIDEKVETPIINGTEGAVTIPAPRPQPNKAWYPSSLRKPMEQARDLLPHDVNEVMGAPFFVIFWHLTMGDIAYSAEAYDKAIAKITSMDRDVSSWRTTAIFDQKSERVRLKARIEVLSKEKEAQASAADSMKRRLARESKQWFGTFVLDKGLQRKLAYQLHQHCFFPRALLTAADAVYVARFIRLAHDLGTVGFSTLFSYSNFFSDALSGCIFSCTTNEARNFGRCLAAIMADLDIWHKDEKRYRREALGLDPDNEDAEGLPGMVYRSRSELPLAPMTWRSFREVYAKWQNTITRALLSCWAESDFMHIKNGITVAIQILKSYPVMQTSGEAVESAVKDLIAGKNGTLTPDLQHQCQAYLRMLNQRKATHPYVLPGSFHAGGVKLNPPKPATVAKSAGASPAPANGEAKPNGTSTPVTTPADPKALRAKLEENKASRSASAATAAAAAAAAAASSTATTKEESGTKAEIDSSGASPAPSAPPAGPRATRSTASLPTAPTGPSSSIRGHASTSSTDRVPTGPARAPPAAPATTRSTSNMGPPASTSLSIDEERAAARARKFGTLTRPQPPSGPSATTKADTVATTAAAASDTRKTQSPAPSPARRSGRSGSIESGTTERSGRDRERRESRDQRTSEDKRDSRELLPEKENGARSRTPVGADEPERRRLSRDSVKREDKDAKPERESFSTRSRRREEEAPRRIDDPRERDRDKDREHRHRRRDERDERDPRDSRDGRRRDERPEDRRDERDRRRREPEREREGDRRPSRDAPPHNDGRLSRDPPPRDVRDTRARDRGSKPPETRARDLPPHERDDRDRRDTRSRPEEGNNGGRTPRDEAANGRSSVPPVPAGPHGDRIIEAPRSTRSNDREARLPARPDSHPSRTEPTPAGSSRTTHALPARPGATSSDRQSPAPNGRNGSSLASRMGPPATGPTTSVPSTAPSDRVDRPNDLRKRPHDESTPPAREDSPGASKRVKIDRDKARSHDRRGREGKEGGGGGPKMLSSAVKSATE